MSENHTISSSKVPEVTLAFWIIKIGATTLGETAGDALSMTMRLGYAISSFIFFVCFVVAVAAQVRAKAFHPFLYWAVILATTTVGTTMADFVDRSVGIGYPGGSLSLFIILMLVLGLWRFSLGSVSVNYITSPKVEIFYWTTILFSNTLGTALGDLLSDGADLGYVRAAMVFGGALGVLAACYFWTTMSRTLLFWAAFILTRPLGATLGDLLTKPREDGGFHLGRIDASAVIAVFIVACIVVLPQKAGSHPGRALTDRPRNDRTGA